MTRIDVLAWEQHLPVPRDQLFPFFADASNLEKLTPPFLRFRILTPPPVEMRVGTVIDYELRLYGVPFRWRTMITEWDPPHRFVDEQLRGPYRLWRHEHRFEPHGDGTRVIDRVEYRPLGGRLTNRLFVERDVRRIFAHRHDVLAELYETSAARAS